MKISFFLVFLFCMKLHAQQGFTTILNYQDVYTTMLVADGNYLYTGSYNHNTFNAAILKVDLTQSSPTATPVFLELEQEIIGGLAIQGGYLYVAESDNIYPSLGKVYRIDLSVTTPTLEEIVEINNPGGLVFWNNDLYLSSGSSIFKVDINVPDPAPVEIINDLNMLGVHGTYGLCVVGNYLYITEDTQIVRYDLNTANPVKELVLGGFNNLVTIAPSCSENALYFSDFNSSNANASSDAIYSLDLSTNTWETFMNTGYVANVGLLCHAGYFYVSAYGPEVARTQLLSVPNFDKPEFSVFPNPASETIHVKFKNNLYEEGKISLFNSLGEIIKTEKILNLKTSISVQELPIGSYYLKIGETIKKIIKK